MNHLKWSLLELMSKPSTLVSNRDKGLIIEERTLSLQVAIAHCCRYLSENFSEQFWRGLLPLFITADPTTSAGARKRIIKMS